MGVSACSSKELQSELISSNGDGLGNSGEAVRPGVHRPDCIVAAAVMIYCTKWQGYKSVQ